jgi:hypothetical protein
MSPFPEKLRNWFLRVYDGECQYQFYDKDGNLQQCAGKGEQVHHPVPETYLINQEHVDPNSSPGLLVCLFHHIIGRGEVFEPDGSFHPDMGEARQKYWQDKESFRKAGEEHHKKAERGERFWGGDFHSDEYYLDLARQKELEYQLSHPEDPKPTPPKHPKLMKAKKWYHLYEEDLE